MPNPWADDLKARPASRQNGLPIIGRLLGREEVLPYLFAFAGINGSFAVLTFLILTVTPWSQLDWLHQTEFGLAFAFGFAEAMLPIRSDVNSRTWQAWTAGVVCLNLVWLWLMISLDG